MNFIRNRNFRAGPQTSLEGFICPQNSDKQQKIKVFGRSEEGVGSMTAVLQDEMRMSEAMNNYLTAYYKYKVANLSLLKLTGQLEQVK